MRCCLRGCGSCRPIWRCSTGCWVIRRCLGAKGLLGGHSAPLGFGLWHADPTGVRSDGRLAGPYHAKGEASRGLACAGRKVTPEGVGALRQALSRPGRNEPDMQKPTCYGKAPRAASGRGAVRDAMK